MVTSRSNHCINCSGCLDYYFEPLSSTSCDICNMVVRNFIGASRKAGYSHGHII